MHMTCICMEKNSKTCKNLGVVRCVCWANARHSFVSEAITNCFKHVYRHTCPARSPYHSLIHNAEVINI